MQSGLTQEEVESSIPLVSTRAIDFLLKEIFGLEPITVLLVAAIIEAEDFGKKAAHEAAKILHETPGFPMTMLDLFLTC